MADLSYLHWPFFDKSYIALRQELNVFAEKHTQNAELEESDEDLCAKNYVKALAAAQLLSLSVPKKYGGRFEKLNARALCLARESLAYHSALLDFSFAMQGLGSGPISLFGSEEQKQAYLPAVADGSKIAAFALSEESAGSDVSALACKAELAQGNYILNGTKAWISNAGFADFYIVFARTTQGIGAKGLSAFIVDATSKGLSVTQRVKISSPHPLGSLSFKDCIVPASNMLAAPGDGFKVAMATLDVFRSSVGAAALGFARRAFDEALAFAKKREVFSAKLSEFQMIQDRLATIATEIDASALMVYRSAWCKDHGAERVTREASMAKMYATESAQRVIDSAIQILGARGVVANSILERLYRDIRPLRVYEGTTEIQKIVIARQVLL